ncbi:MAG: hypothetical protein NTW86_24640 [Candidatus Sumerlaeota bacterium]|nr:hypothetical protein [Candidatus Sumerlaeota bacterium]
MIAFAPSRCATRRLLRPTAAWTAIFLLSAVAARPAAAQSYRLVRDINPGAGSSNPTELTSYQGLCVFAADDGVHGVEPWRSDGKYFGTYLISDIRPGDKSSNPGPPAPAFTVFNGLLHFPADDGSHGVEPWVSDATAAGTGLVSDVNLGPSGSGSWVLIPGGSLLFFAPTTLPWGQEVWKTNGTAAGTSLIKDLYPGPDTTNAALLQMGFLNKRLYFAGDDASDIGRELWSTDGTSLGTSLVKDIALGSPESVPQDFLLYNSLLLFTASDSTNGRELWRTDGTALGTQLVRDINPLQTDSFIQEMRLSNGIVYFQAFDGSHGRELWRSDGTSAGTYLVKDIYPSGISGLPTHLTDVNGTLFCAANGQGSGTELWRSDGTASGTVLVKDIFPGSRSSSPRELYSALGTLFFVADDGVHGRELWASDGTAAGTILVVDINPGAAGSDPQHLTLAGKSLYFSADDGVYGRELWKLSLGEPGPPTLESVLDIGAGSIGLTWNHWYGAPTDFLGAAWDLYTGAWTPPAAPLHALGNAQQRTGVMNLGNTGGYHVWVLAEYPGGVVVPTTTPWTGTVYSGVPHTPLDSTATALAQPLHVALAWKPEIYGTFQYQIIAFRAGTGFVSTIGPEGDSLWHFVTYPQTAFFSGSVELTVPSPGDYWFLIRAVGWQSPDQASEYVLPFATVP